MIRCTTQLMSSSLGNYVRDKIEGRQPLGRIRILGRLLAIDDDVIVKSKWRRYNYTYTFDAKIVDIYKENNRVLIVVEQQLSQDCVRFLVLPSQISPPISDA